MDLEAILTSLERIEFPEKAESGAEAETLLSSFRRMMVIGEKLGRAEFRASQNAEHIAERLDSLEEQFQSQLETRETELREERRKVGELLDEVQALLVGLVQIADLVSAGRAASQAEAERHEVQLIQRLADEIDRILRRVGLEPLAKPGEMHDPQFHEPVAEERSTQARSREILEVVKQGYRYSGRVLRVAKVVIAK